MSREDSLFGDLPATAPQPEPEKHACIECRKFAGQSRDRRAWLFRIKKGYCDDDRWHIGGKWAVLQDIVMPHHCDFFEAADKKAVDQRIKALEYYEQKK